MSFNIKQQLSAIFSDYFTDQKSILERYGKDLSVDSIANPSFVVFPTDTNQLIALVTLANKEKISLVPSGGRTGYSGGAVANNQEIVVSFEKMRSEFCYDSNNALLTCSAGFTLKEIQDEAKKHNMIYPVNIAPKDKCQIGGNIATNAGGIHVIKYGMTRQWVRALEVVTGKGDLLQLNHGLCKNNAGINLMQNFIGSEGVLGFITKATLLFTSEKQTQFETILIGINDFSMLPSLYEIFYKKLDIKACEFFTEYALNQLIHKKQYNMPLTKAFPYYLMIDFNNLENMLIILKDYNISKEQYILSKNISANELWKYRLEISRSLADKHPFKFDIAVLPSKIYNFISEVNHALNSKFQKNNIIWFGHVGDGNVHLNLLKDDKDSLDIFKQQCADATQSIYNLVNKFNGTVSAEHGIGLLKKPYLKFCKSEHEIEYMKSIKNVFDPNNIMNPGKIFI